MADLTTLAAVKQWLNVTATTDDALLASLVSGVSAWVQSWLSRQILSASYSDTLNGNGKDLVFLKNAPITAVASVSVDAVAIPVRTAIGQSGYYFDDDAVYLDGYSFTKNRQNVIVAYTAGYAAVPLDLELATKKLVGMSYKEKDRIGQSSVGLAGSQTNFIITDLPKDVQSILWQYRRVVPVAA